MMQGRIRKQTLKVYGHEEIDLNLEGKDMKRLDNPTIIKRARLAPPCLMETKEYACFIYILDNAALCSVNDVLPPLGGACQLQNPFLGGTVPPNA